MDGLQFETFEITPSYKIKYTWSDIHPQFNEETLKNEIKEIMTVKNTGNPFFDAE